RFGTRGVGLFAQANQLFLIGVLLGSLSTVNGVIASLARARRGADRDSRDEALATAFTIQLAASLGLALVIALASRPIAHLLFGSGVSSWLVVAIGVSLPFGVLASGYLVGIFFADERVHFYTRSSAVATFGAL